MLPSTVFPDLKDRSVLITGGGSGIGASLTEGFIAQGARVAFIDIAAEPSKALADQLEQKYGNRPLYLETDLRDLDALRKAVATAEAENGAVTVLVNNAAWDDRHTVEDVTEEYWNLNHSINLRPQFFAIQAVLPGMKKAGGGSIINFTSISFMINQGDLPAYTAAKAGVIGLTKGLAGTLGPDKIRVNAIAPGWVMTERQKALWVTEESLKVHVGKQCLKEAVLPDDMVGPCLFLASDAARMLTAQTMIVDGGYL
ncbi:SDR family NAD(P)-dependent oxidoreductase [Phyllobacterium salinisoli]|uniref:SDR family NAD(P)-dependent oxidoreductase n=1 Tax=Phyllobacterium salinisoli TaxID=1899321 RepID=A0A368K783_9HYPH|nr:SDR family oxidoreductase [Phyllobacterium salinisoli]RCS25081.1 SDR family NAD(P)-dependent oxidoreductase [Phyllobacterium salinisoli]